LNTYFSERVSAPHAHDESFEKDRENKRVRVSYGEIIARPEVAFDRRGWIEEAFAARRIILSRVLPIPLCQLFVYNSLRHDDQ
jgi:hypothetical protein